MVLAPAVALVASDDAGSTPLVLTAIGLALTLGGNAVVSNRIAEPNYDRMLAWDPEHMPPDWEATQRYFNLNWIRAVSTWTAFALFLGARSWNCANPHGAALMRERDPPAGEAGLLRPLVRMRSGG